MRRLTATVAALAAATGLSAGLAAGGPDGQAAAPRRLAAAVRRRRHRFPRGGARARDRPGRRRRRRDDRRRGRPAGRIGVRFRAMTLGDCPTYVISARGNKGSSAGLRSVPAPLRRRPVTLPIRRGAARRRPLEFTLRSRGYGRFSVQAPKPCVVTYIRRCFWSMTRFGTVVVGSPGATEVQPVCGRTRLRETEVRADVEHALRLVPLDRPDRQVAERPVAGPVEARERRGARCRVEHDVEHVTRRGRRHVVVAAVRDQRVVRVRRVDVDVRRVPRRIDRRRLVDPAPRRSWPGWPRPRSW